jgi:TolB-like protein/Tfp pilus assembly protein PilF
VVEQVERAALLASQVLQHSAVERHLEKIISSKPFAGSERMIRFLRFIVDQTLAGKAAEIKEYTIGIAAFDRPASFDPRSDAVVRVEARRLRSKLAEYYQDEGKSDSIRIDLPKGAYVPVIQQQAPAVNLPASEPATHWAGPAMVVFALTIVSLLVFRAIQVAKSPGIFPAHVNSIAVLPFVDMSEKRDQEYFCEGMTEEVIHTLAQIPGLRVPARTSVYRLRNADIPEVGRQLHVETVLEGSVRKEGDNLRVTAQLIRVSDNTHLWSETYDQTTKTVFSIQQSIARAIVDKLRGQGAGTGIHASSTVNQEAHNRYLMGRFYANKMSSPTVRQSIDYFKQAIAKDPNYAQAYAGLAESYDLAKLFNALPTPVSTEAKAAALKAISLDDSLGEAHVALARDLMWNGWDWAGAERELKRAIELSPQYPEAYQVYSWNLAYRGYPDKALLTIQKALDLDPLSARIGNVHAALLLFARRYDQALAASRKVIEMEPTFGRAYQTMGRVLVLQRRYDEGIAVLQKSVEMGASGEGRLGWLGWAYGVAGRRDEAMKALHDATSGERPSPIAVALIYTGLGDRDHAFEWLDRASANHGLIAQIQDPDWDNLQSDPRYAGLLKKTGVR